MIKKTRPTRRLRERDEGVKKFKEALSPKLVQIVFEGVSEWGPEVTWEDLEGKKGVEEYVDDFLDDVYTLLHCDDPDFESDMKDFYGQELQPVDDFYFAMREELEKKYEFKYPAERIDEVISAYLGFDLVDRLSEIAEADSRLDEAKKVARRTSRKAVRENFTYEDANYDSATAVPRILAVLVKNPNEANKATKEAVKEFLNDVKALLTGEDNSDAYISLRNNLIKKYGDTYSKHVDIDINDAVEEVFDIPYDYLWDALDGEDYFKKEVVSSFQEKTKRDVPFGKRNRVREGSYVQSRVEKEANFNTTNKPNVGDVTGVKYSEDGDLMPSKAEVAKALALVRKEGFRVKEASVAGILSVKDEHGNEVKAVPRTEQEAQRAAAFVARKPGRSMIAEAIKIARREGYKAVRLRESDEGIEKFKEVLLPTLMQIIFNGAADWGMEVKWKDLGGKRGIREYVNEYLNDTYSLVHYNDPDFANELKDYYGETLQPLDEYYLTMRENLEEKYGFKYPATEIDEAISNYFGFDLVDRLSEITNSSLNESKRIREDVNTKGEEIPPPRYIKNHSTGGQEQNVQSFPASSTEKGDLREAIRVLRKAGYRPIRERTKISYSPDAIEKIAAWLVEDPEKISKKTRKAITEFLDAVKALLSGDKDYFPEHIETAQDRSGAYEFLENDLIDEYSEIYNKHLCYDINAAVEKVFGIPKGELFNRLEDEALDENTKHDDMPFSKKVCKDKRNRVRELYDPFIDDDDSKAAAYADDYKFDFSGPREYGLDDYDDLDYVDSLTADASNFDEKGFLKDDAF